MRRLDIFQKKADTALFVGPNNTLIQSFTPTKDNIAGIRFPVFNPKLGGQKSYQIVILDDKNQSLRQEIVKESNLGWGQTFRYDFSPVQNSKDKQFKFMIMYLEEDTQNSEILTKINTSRIESLNLSSISSDIIDSIQKNYISISYSRTDNYGKGAAILNDQLLKGDLVFEAYYQTNMEGFIKDSIIDFVGRGRQDLSFFIFYFLLVFTLSILLFYRLIKDHR